jgi:hypothetical protein
MFKEWVSRRNKNIYSTGRETKQSLRNEDERSKIQQSEVFRRGKSLVYCCFVPKSTM